MIQIILSVYGTGTNPITNCLFPMPGGSTVYQLLLKLELDGMLPKRFGQTEGFQDILVFVNHENAAAGAGLTKRILQDGERVVIMPSMAGG